MGSRVGTRNSIFRNKQNAENHPVLWFDSQAEEAANFYVGIQELKDIEVCNVMDKRLPRFPGSQRGSVNDGEFSARRPSFVALNGGPVYKISPAISFVVNCETQEEVDEYWEKLTAGGGESNVWLADRQIRRVPADRSFPAGRKLLSDPDPVKSGRVMRRCCK